MLYAAAYSDANADTTSAHADTTSTHGNRLLRPDPIQLPLQR
jgi:hypothetical protein